MKTVILAAGLSTRLYPDTADKPKPMLDVDGHPMMEYVVHNLAVQGFTDIIITLHFKPEVIQNFFGDEKKFGCSIQYSYEERLLGTAGSLKAIEDKLTDIFLVCSGSYIVSNLNIPDLVDYHLSHNYCGTIALNNTISKENLHNFGQAVLNRNSTIVKFQEKPKIAFSNLVHSTYQVYSKRVLKDIDKGKYISIPDTVIPRLVSKKEVCGYVCSGRLY